MKLIELYSKIKYYLHNTLWMMGDKISNLAIGFLVTVVVARYLGPEDFGIYSYALSLAALFAAAGHMGLSGLVVREIVKKPDERATILGTTLLLKLSGMLIGYFALVIYAYIYEGLGSIEFNAIAIVGAILIFKSFDIIDFWFQAFIQAKYVTFARLIGLFIDSSLKLVFVFLGLGLIYFVTATLVQSIIVAIALLIAYKIKSIIKISEWKFNWIKAKELLSQGWVIYLGSIFAVIYLKVDQVMLRWYVGAEAVGIYAVAAQISEAWYFIPTAIVASFFPKLIKLREESTEHFNKRLQQLFDLLFIIAIMVAIIMTILSDWFINLFFGNFYSESASVLVIHIWAAIFIFMRAAFSKWILIENALIFSLVTQGAGAIINIILNYLLIPKYGVIGAAYATIISYSFASFFSLLIYKKTRPVFFMMLNSILFIFRLKIKGIK